MTKQSSSTNGKNRKTKQAVDPSEAAISDPADQSVEYLRLLEENQRLTKIIRERETEFDIINSVQEGLASKADIQSIYELVGEKIREVFDAQGIDLTAYDDANELTIFHYSYEKGKRLEISPAPFTDRVRYFRRTKLPLVVNENLSENVMRLTGSPPVVHAGELPRSMIMMPLIINDQAKGHLMITNIDREHAFSETDVRLLAALARSTSVALENVRLFDETQRLLHETEQRNAELAIINSVQAGLASKLDIRSIYDLVGDKLREIFKADTTFIAFHDAKRENIIIPYYADKSVKKPFARPYGNGLYEPIVENGKPIIGGSIDDFARLGATYRVVSPGSQKDLNESYMGVPIFKAGIAIGATSIQSYTQNAYNENDLRLLETLTNSMSVALENAHLFDETQRLLKETEQRAAELAIVNSVQEGLASKLEVQAIYELVGDKIRDIFHATGTAIYIFDHETENQDTPYCFLKQRFVIETHSYSPMCKAMLDAPQLRIYHNVEEYRALGGQVLENGEEFKSGLIVPMMVGKEIKGMVHIANLDLENAYGTSDLRLLSTLASSMSVALENARLFDETQRLLKETEQRNAELAIINSVQEGLVSNVDIQAIYDLVGEKIRDVFDAQGIDLCYFDDLNEKIVFRYSYEKGQRMQTAPIPFTDRVRYLKRTRQPIVINEDLFEKSIKLTGSPPVVPSGELPKSVVMMPLIISNTVKGCIVINNIDRENAFSESDVRLLETLARSTSIALENARLFDETQRLLKETEQRNAELAIINSVQDGLASKLDVQAIYDLVGEKIRSLFDAQIILIMAFDPVARTRQVKYYGEYGQRLTNSPGPLPFNKLAEHLVETKETLVFNNDLDRRINDFGMTIIEGTTKPKSAVFVPQVSGDRIIGLISLQNVEKENAFTESDINLLSTFAASMSVAIENAQLYEEQLHVAEELKLVNKMRSQFLSSMSHELRTPLNAIINFIEIMEQGLVGPVNQEQGELLGHALNSSRHLLNLINDVLDISKIQAGRLTLVLEDQVNLREEIDVAWNMMEGLARGKKLNLFREIDPDIPLTTCDRRRVRQVLLNLLSNAIKFTKIGSVTLTVKNLGAQVQFAIVDTGPGIPASDLELIFDPFIQLENAAGLTQGTGLGLPISRSLVRAHGGDLWVESAVGAGSSFIFSLPLNGK